MVPGFLLRNMDIMGVCGLLEGSGCSMLCASCKPLCTRRVNSHKISWLVGPVFYLLRADSRATSKRRDLRRFPTTSNNSQAQCHR